MAELTDQNKVFLFHLMEGKSPEEAYTLAGYTPDKALAYELKEALKEDYAKLISRYGFSKEDIHHGILKLLNLPLEEKEIKVKDKIKLLELAEKVTSGTVPLADIIDSLVIQRGTPALEPPKKD